VTFYVRNICERTGTSFRVSYLCANDQVMISKTDGNHRRHFVPTTEKDEPDTRGMNLKGFNNGRNPKRWYSSTTDRTEVNGCGINIVSGYKK
jgi:hypothetical protein